MDLLKDWQQIVQSVILKNEKCNNKESSVIGFLRPLSIPSPFLSLIGIILTDFRARRISGTETDHS